MGGSRTTMSNSSRGDAPLKSRRTISKVNLTEVVQSNGEVVDTVPAHTQAQEELLNSLTPKTSPEPAVVKTSSGKKMYSKLPDDF